MKFQLMFELDRPARKKGGDRYACKTNGFEDFQIYIPQAISRLAGRAREQLKVTIDTLED